MSTYERRQPNEPVALARCDGLSPNALLDAVQFLPDLVIDTSGWRLPDEARVRRMLEAFDEVIRSQREHDKRSGSSLGSNK